MTLSLELMGFYFLKKPLISSWGRKPIVYGACIVAMVFRIIAFLVHDYYWAMLVCIAISGPFGMGKEKTLTLIRFVSNLSTLPPYI